MPFFSVIIPVYNIEEFIEECVNSILSQTFKDYEIILVNDGSTDKSLSLCRRLENNSKRIMVIDKKNGGLSSARNAGIKEAKGKYLFFVDGDDYLCNNQAFYNIYSIASNTNYDVISFNHDSVEYDTGEVLPCDDKRLLSDNSSDFYQMLMNLIRRDTFYGSAWVLCTKKDFILSNDLFFQEGTNTEDLDWIIRIVNKTPKIYNVEDIVYRYRLGRVGSITRSVNYVRQTEFINMIQKYADYEYSNSKVKEAILNYLAYQYLIYCAWNQQITDREQRKELIDKEKPLRYLLEYDAMKSVKMANTVRRVFGYRIMDVLLGKYLRRKFKIG